MPSCSVKIINDTEFFKNMPFIWLKQKGTIIPDQDMS